MANNKAVSEKVLLDKYSVLHSKERQRYGQPSYDPQALISVCNNAELVQKYKSDLDIKQHNELLLLCDTYKKDYKH